MIPGAHRHRLAGVSVALLLWPAAVLAEPYWIAYEGEDFPENVGWERSWGNWQGQYQGGAHRSIENGVLTYDSLYDPGVYDFAYMERPGEIDPAPGELFVMEWRLKVEEVVGLYDPGVVVFSDEAWGASFCFTEELVFSAFDPELNVPIAPGVFHEYRMLSWDMLTYEFYVDAELAHVGSLWHGIGPSYVGWGEGVQGAASLHHWDYFRFGVVRAPRPHIVPSVAERDVAASEPAQEMPSAEGCGATTEERETPCGS